MTNKRSDRRFSINTIVKFLNEKKIFKSFRITYQVIWNLLLVFFIGLFSLGLFVGGAGAGFFASLVVNEPIRSIDSMEKDIYNYEEISEIYFANDVYLGNLPTEIERKEIPLKEVSVHLINALIATEDEYFFEHEGIVPKAIFRATFQEFSGSAIQTGGSTLTQQLIKNQILTNEVSFERKAKEILLALRLENFFNKEEILEAYLNVVPFGRNANGMNIAGVQAAAHGIFGVDAKDLTLPQAAYIAGLPQSPFGYTPFLSMRQGVKENLQPSLNRMKTVLTRMKDNGYITENEYSEAISYDIRANLIESSPTTIQEYPFLMEEVERRAIEVFTEQLLERDGINLEEIEDNDKKVATMSKYRELARRDLRRNGYQIHTTINKGIYDAHKKVIENDKLFAGVNNLGEPEEVGAVLIDNKTGAIISFVGGRDYWRQSYNHATQSDRQNGSTMKPLIAYAPAIEIGALQPGFLIADTPMHYKNDPLKEIKNFDHKNLGLMSVREALQRSRNVPAVKGFNKISYEYGRETLQKLGFNITDGGPFEPTALGALDVTVEQNTAAYSIFASDGKYKKSYMIDKIVSKDGEVVYKHEQNEVEVFSPQTAYLTVNMLRDVHVSPGTAPSLPGMLNFQTDLAGKTGTTNDSFDSWYVGLNPNFSMGVWIGYDTKSTLKGKTGPRTQKIWASLANAAYEIDPEFIAPNDDFKMPSGIVRQSFCGISGLLASDLCREADLVRTDLFNSKYIPKTADDSLERVNFVMLKGGPYRALETTPIEFTQEGIAIKGDYFSEDENIFEYLPEEWENIIPNRVPEDNGKIPAAISTAQLDGDLLKWSEHSDEDIIGYRIYEATNGSSTFTVVDNIRSDVEELSTKVKNGPYAYRVTAVDVTGRESQPSKIFVVGDWQKEIPAENDEDKVDEIIDPINEEPGQKPNDGDQENPSKPPQDDRGEGDNGNVDEIIPDPLEDLTTYYPTVRYI